MSAFPIEDETLRRIAEVPEETRRACNEVIANGSRTRSLSEAAVKTQKLVAEKAKLSAEAADLRASAGVTDMVNAAPTTLDDVTLDELRVALSKALERF